MPKPLVIDTLVDLAPLAPELGSEDIVPASLAPALLGDWGLEDGQSRLYAVLDAAQIPGLVDILENQELSHTCLYTGTVLEKQGDVSPWLVELQPDSRMLRDLMTATGSPDTDGPWHFWRRQVGIFIRSDQPIKVVLAHLRKYIRIREEGGGTFFFRFFEPDFLAPLLTQADAGEIAGFFAPLKSIIAIEQHSPDNFAASIMSAHPELDAQPTGLTLTRRKYRALKLVEFNRVAQRLCAHHDIPKEQHRAFINTAVRLQDNGHMLEGEYFEAFNMLRQIPTDQHAGFWKVVAEGQYSLCFILFRANERFGLERKAS